MFIPQYRGEINTGCVSSLVHTGWEEPPVDFTLALTLIRELPSVELLTACLSDKFGLKTSIHTVGGRFRIYIWTRSVPKFKALVLPYFHPCMLYRLGQLS